VKKMIVSVLALIVLASAAFAGSVTPLSASLKAVDANGISSNTATVYTLEGISLTPNSLDTGRISLYIQDPNTNMGICVDGAKLMSVVSTLPVLGDKVNVTGKLYNYSGLLELVIDTTDIVNNFVVTAGPFAFSTTLATIAQLNSFDSTAQTGGERYEGNLVRLDNVTLVSASSTFGTAGSDANIWITQGTDSCVIRIDKDLQADGTVLPETAIAGTAFTVIGVIQQYDTSAPRTSGYQITPRFASDIFIPPAAVREWEIYSE